MPDQNQPLDYYEILGVSFDASDDEIRRAYRRVAMEWHPDRNKDTNAPRMMRRINEAWDVLGKPERRAEYDRDYFLLRSMIAEAARRAHEEERQERERQQEQERREAEERIRRAEAERRERERQEAAERERRERERRRRTTENRYRREQERQSSARAQHGGSTTKHPSRSSEQRQKPRIFDNGLLAWSLVGLAMIIVTIPFILLWLNLDDEPPTSETVRSSVIATRTPRPSPPPPRPTATPAPKLAAAPVSKSTPSPIIKPTETRTNTPIPTATRVVALTATSIPKPTATHTPKPTATPKPVWAGSDTVVHDLLSNSNVDSYQLKILVDAGAPLETRDYIGRTPIEVAAYYNQSIPVLRLLIDAGAQLQNAPGALHGILSRSNTSPETVKLLIDAGASLETRDYIGRTPIEIAADYNQSIHIFRLLLDAGTRLQNAPEVLHGILGNSSASPQTVKLLIDAGASLETRDYIGRTPIEVAADYNQRIHIFRLLIDAGTRLQNAPEVLHGILGNSSASPETVKLLIDAGAPLETLDYIGRTPIEVAADYNQDAQIIQMIIDAMNR